MTDKYIDISKEAAEASGRPFYRPNPNGITRDMTILVNDNGACAELAVEYRIQILPHPFYPYVIVAWYEGSLDGSLRKAHKENLSEHNNDRMLATNYAILSAVIEINKARGLG